MTETTAGFKSPLHQMTQTTATCLWNDSASLQELNYSIAHGGVGATCNPVIVVDVLNQELAFWTDRVAALVRALPTATEDAIAWRLVEEMSVRAAALLEPAFVATKGRNGRLSVQTDPRFYRDRPALVQQATRFAGLAPNIIVKIPVTEAGVEAIEEATYRGISINATVSFSVPQALAVAEAVERGLARREREGQAVAGIASVCTIMVGRLDDWLKVVSESGRGPVVDPAVLEWAGVAAFKKAYGLYQRRGYRVRLLAAAYRNDLHWTEFVGGDVVLSPPHKWQVRFNESGIEPEPRIDQPVDSAVIDALLRFEDFRRAYAEDGMSISEFVSFAPTRRTLRQFIGACHTLASQVRDIMLPDPDR